MTGIQTKALILIGAFFMGAFSGGFLVRKVWQASELSDLRAENAALQASLEQQKQAGRAAVALTARMAGLVAETAENWLADLSALASERAAIAENTQRVLDEIDQNADGAGGNMPLPDWVCRAEADAIGAAGMPCASE